MNTLASPNGINLIPVPRLAVMARRRRVRRWLAASAAYGLLLITGYTICIASAGSDVDATGSALDKANRQIDDLNHSLETLRPQLSEMHARLIVARTVGDQPDWSLLLAVISSTLDDQIVLSNTRLDVIDGTGIGNATVRQFGAQRDTATSRPSEINPRITVALQGFAKSQAAVTQFVLRLERLGLFERVEMVNSSRQPFGNADAMGFRVECELRRTGGGEHSGRKSR